MHREFGLYCLYDEGPAEVTVFPGEALSTTEWLTADVESAVDLEDVRYRPGFAATSHH